ncbi:MAG: hypothetical protein DBX55_00770 [Verrucomicrobia bacterium]|nr:MAG: hypothetical protein DBX55_00770 [Verrucomicrobiota bacterium]
MAARSCGHIEGVCQNFECVFFSVFKSGRFFSNPRSFRALRSVIGGGGRRSGKNYSYKKLRERRGEWTIAQYGFSVRRAGCARCGFRFGRQGDFFAIDKFAAAFFLENFS